MSSHSARLEFLGVVGAAARLLPRGAPAAGRKRYLVIRPDHLGDVLLTTPAFAALRGAEPEAQVIALVGPWSADVLRGSPHVDRVLTYPFPWFDRRQAPLVDRYAAVGGLAAWLRAFRFDRAYVLRTDHWWGAMAAALARIPERIGYAVDENRPFLTRALPLPGHEHVARSALRLVVGDGAATAARPGEPATCFQPSDADHRAADALLEDLGISTRGAGYVVVHPGASTPLKRWPAARWGAVVDDLRGQRLAVLLVGGPGEQAVVEEVAASSTTPPPPRPKTPPSLGQLGAIFERAAFAVGMDSAPMHLATAVGTPTVRLAGPADETLFGPWGDPSRHRVARAPGTHPDPTWFRGGDRPHPTLDALDLATVLREIAALREAIR